MAKTHNREGLEGSLRINRLLPTICHGYGTISKPLIGLLKKRGFNWGQEADLAFERLKKATSEVLVLGLPDFNKPFVVETNACDSGIGAVLSHKGRPLAFLSRALSSRHEGLSIYEKEFLAVLIDVERWRHYLEGGRFIIQTDHESLKFLLQQKL